VAGAVLASFDGVGSGSWSGALQPTKVTAISSPRLRLVRSAVTFNMLRSWLRACNPSAVASVEQSRDVRDRPQVVGTPAATAGVGVLMRDRLLRPPVLLRQALVNVVVFFWLLTR